MKIEKDFYCSNGHASLKVIEAVSGKPGFWSVRKASISSGFKIGGQKRSAPPQPTVMSTGEIIEFYLASVANRAAYEITTTGHGPNGSGRKLRDRMSFHKKSLRLLTRKFTPNPKHLIHEALQRVKVREANQAS